MEREREEASKVRPPLEVSEARGLRLGPVGTTAAIAAIASLLVAVALAIIIPGIVERHLLAGTAESIQTTVNDIAESIRPSDSLNAQDVEKLQTEVEHSLLGREIVRVKIWDRTGTIIVSDEARLIGLTFEMSDDLLAAFSGEVIYEEPDLSRTENVYERDLGDLREYYVPVDSGSQGIEIVFEVYELAAHVVDTVDEIRYAIWVALGIGAIVLLGALGAAAVTNARVEKDRRDRSRRLIGQLIEVREKERTRIVGSLHDDIGQPLYRIMFGLQASKGMIEPGSPVDDELTKLDQLVRDVDTTLRSELTALRQEPGVEIDLESALIELVEVVEGETDLDIDFIADVDAVLPLAHRATLYSATKEALTNVGRHAHADTVMVRLVEGGDSTMIEVVDNGSGTMGPPGLGLTTTRDRLEAIGGGILVSDARGGGTRFVAWVPNGGEHAE
ncbi:MAG: histidine kinase [Actinomycetia bacterium]|nr:histidine kinase [Actinomycetes bacterium]